MSRLVAPLPLLLLALLLPQPAVADAYAWQAFSIELPPEWAVRDKEFVGTVGSKLVILRSPNDTVVAVALIDARRILSGFGGQTLKTMVEAYIQAFWVSALRGYTIAESWPCALAVAEGAATHGLRFVLDGDPKQSGFACGARDLEAGLLIVVLGWAGPESRLDAEATEAEVSRAMRGAGFSASAAPARESAPLP